IELLGTEVKAVRTGKASLLGSFVVIRGGEAFLINANIQPYQEINAPQGYDPLRNRRLLLTKKEIKELSETEANKSLTIVPLSLYSKNRKIKAEIAVARGKKKFDKRETIKKRETDIELRREYKR
ncbi:MAG: SsrA-binding protein SmpB, partial [Candidatus Paceibacteria bacterium]